MLTTCRDLPNPSLLSISRGGGGGGRAVTNVIRTCGPTHLLVFDFMSNKICLNQNFNGVATLEKSNTETRACRTKLDIVMLYSNHSKIL